MTDRRRPRGSATGAPALYARVAQDAFDWVDAAAVRLGVSKAELVERVLLHERDAATANGGVPPWWTKPVPAEEELELRAS